MSFGAQLNDRGKPLFLYGTTPPRAGSSPEQVRTIAQKLVERLRALPLDGLVVYDIQDESGRTALPRPFPFMRTIDPREYSRLLGELTGRAVIDYKSIGQLDEAQWQAWLDETARDYDVRYLTVVGRPTSRGARYAMPLLRAYEIAAAHRARFMLGGVSIAERHGSGASESRRMLDKMRFGCTFFVSQAVYRSGPTIHLLQDYVRECRDYGVAPCRYTLTFTPCGREKTLSFIKWLGIAVSEQTERRILGAPNPLSASIEICRSNLREILSEVDLAALPIGINVESVSINKEEIDASIDLFHALAEVLAGQLR